DRERIRANRPDRARRLGDRRRAPPRDPRRAAGPGTPLRRARGGDRAVKLVRAVDELTQVALSHKVGLVPTMGAFHEGHLSLFRAARSECATVVVSLFVNPTQFGPNEDLARYPRDMERDARLAQAAEVDVLFMPSAE